MDYSTFVKSVRERAGLRNNDEALAVIAATLTTLGERLAGNEAANLAAQLPQEFQPYLSGKASTTPVPNFGVVEFVNRVAKREGVDDSEAARHTRAVMTTLADAVSGGEIADVAGQLPAEYGALFIMRGDDLADLQNWDANAPTA